MSLFNERNPLLMTDLGALPRYSPNTNLYSGEKGSYVPFSMVQDFLKDVIPNVFFENDQKKNSLKRMLKSAVYYLQIGGKNDEVSLRTMVGQDCFPFGSEGQLTLLTKNLNYEEVENDGFNSFRKIKQNSPPVNLLQFHLGPPREQNGLSMTATWKTIYDMPKAQAFQVSIGDFESATKIIRVLKPNTKEPYKAELIQRGNMSEESFGVCKLPYKMSLAKNQDGVTEINSIICKDGFLSVVFSNVNLRDENKLHELTFPISSNLNNIQGTDDLIEKLSKKIQTQESY